MHDIKFDGISKFIWISLCILLPIQGISQQGWSIRAERNAVKSQRYSRLGNMRAEGMALVYANSDPGLKRERSTGGVIHGYDGARAK